jgi:hypothetical protein
MSGNLPAINERDPTRIIQGIRDLFFGRSNATGSFTLAAGTTSTTVIAINCGDGSNITLRPKTSNAAAALATTFITDANITPGQFIVTHANAGTTDRTFGYSIQG